MGAFIVKQPNGLYCRFSTVVDCPTDWNMTAEDYRELRAEDARRDADLTLEYHLRPFEWLREYFRPMNMTEEEFEECLKSMVEDPPEKPALSESTIYILHERDRWADWDHTRGCYSSKEKAIRDLLEDNTGLIYDERYDKWNSPDYTRYFYISEETLH